MDYELSKVTLTGNNIIFMCNVTEESIKELILAVDYLYQEGQDTVYLFINSTGGELYSAISAYEYIKTYRKSMKIITIGTGRVNRVAHYIYY